MPPEFVTDNIASLKPGYFGKIPSHGDFIFRGLPKSFTQPWDAWLQEAITASRKQLGAQWLDHYLTSPIYRFALSAGICGTSTWLGILMPSVDRVGRYYPMTIGALAQPSTNPLLALQQYNAWFEQIESLALTCLQDDFDMDSFSDQLANLTLETQQNKPEESSTAIPSESNIDLAWQRPVEQVTEITKLLPELFDDLIKEFCLAYSVWWTQGSEQVAASLLVCEGLPPFEGVAALFDGNWQKWGWENRRFPL